MLECKSCHTSALSRLEDRGARSEPLPWRTTKMFKHETHRIDARAPGDRRALPCELCHKGALESPLGRLPPRPTMVLCAETCHNGETAFKATGFECARCHGNP
jgi:hypothetical protein